MNRKIVVFLALLSLVCTEPDDSVREGRFIGYKKKGYGDVYKKLERSEMEETKRSEEFAGEALDGMYTDCLAQLSFSCLQKKVLSFINRMNRMEKFPLIGNYVSVVRTKDEYEHEPEFQARLNTAEQQSGLDDLMQNSIDRFFRSHIVRVKIPNSFSVINPSTRSYEDATSLDFRFPGSEVSDEARKRGGGGGGGGGKMTRKMMMMMMMGLKAKLLMLTPIILGIAGIISIKALIASAISLTISKIMLIKKLMKNKHGSGGHGGWEQGGGGGGGWSSGGGGSGGGWDRRSFQETTSKSWDASDLAYRAYSTVENLF